MVAKNQTLRAVIFGGPTSVKSTLLTRTALQLAAQRDDFKVVAIVDTKKSPLKSRGARNAELVKKHLLARLFNRSSTSFLNPAFLQDIYSVARKYKVEVLTPRDRNINHPEFITQLREQFKPNLALSLGCSQIFRKDLIETFEQTINNHNGILPDYRGWGNTEWSIYNGEAKTGFTYHYLTEKIDEGPILSTGSVTIANHPPMRLQYEKAKLAASQLDGVITAVAQREAGTPQTGQARYYRSADLEDIITLAAPALLTWSELQKRLRAFGKLKIRLGGELLPVTHLTVCANQRKSDFISADGVAIQATRFEHLPSWLYQRLNKRA